MNGPPLMILVASLLSGVLLGIVYFRLLHRSVQLQLQPETAALQKLLPLVLLRIGLAVVVFWGLAQFGAWALLTGLTGFLIARTGAQYLVRNFQR